MQGPGFGWLPGSHAGQQILHSEVQHGMEIEICKGALSLCSLPSNDLHVLFQFWFHVDQYLKKGHLAQMAERIPVHRDEVAGSIPAVPKATINGLA